MKKSILNYGLSLLAAVALAMPIASCSSDDEGPKSSQLTVTIALPAGFSAADVENPTLTLTKGDKSDEIALDNITEAYEATVVNGKYTIAFNGKIKGENYSFLVGQKVVEVYAATAVNLEVAKASKSPLVFKTIYTTGGKDYYMKDSYFEIVNNSDEVQYLDGLLMSRTPHNNIYDYENYSAPNPWQANGLEDLYSCGQGCIIQFPGNGTDYPLQPGESVIVANDAMNHKAKPADEDGDYSNCPNLEDADFEVYLPSAFNEPSCLDADKQMKIVYNTSQYTMAFALGVSSGGYVLAKLPAGVTAEDFASDPNYLMFEPGSDNTFMKYLCIPSAWVLDAVDMWDCDESEHTGVFLAKDDAQGVLGGEKYKGWCLVRKVASTDNGRTYYQDTNNSANDFDKVKVNTIK